MNGAPGNTTRDAADAGRSAAEQEKERHQQDDLDEALDESFPASDPPSPYISDRTQR